MLKSILEALFWVVMATLLIIASMFIFGWGAVPVLGYMGAVATLVMFPMVLRMITMVRRRRGAAIITYLEQAVRLNLPLPRMLAAARRSEGGVLGERLGTLQKLMESGTTLGTALRIAVPEMGASPAAMLDAAESVGRLPHALRRLVRKYALKSPEEATDSIYLRAYPFVMTLMMTVSLALFFNFVLPKYETIFKDFGTKLPPITQFVIDAMYQVGPLLAILAIASVIGWAALSLWKIVHPRSAEWNVLHRARDRVLWSLPLTRGLERDRGMADALDFIADALRAGQPMERAVDEASMLRINVMLKRQLTRWSGGLRSGSPLAESARAAGLPGLIPEMLTPARSGEQAIEVMAFLARYFDARFSRTRVLIRAAAVPVMVFVFAIIVATIALAMLAPMATLIGNMSAGSARSHWKI